MFPYCFLCHQMLQTTSEKIKINNGAGTVWPLFKVLVHSGSGQLTGQTHTWAPVVHLVLHFEQILFLLFYYETIMSSSPLPSPPSFALIIALLCFSVVLFHFSSSFWKLSILSTVLFLFLCRLQPLLSASKNRWDQLMPTELSPDF